MTGIHFTALILCNPSRTKALLLKRSLLKPNGTPRFLGGLVTGVGGKLEAGETPEQCITREFTDETASFIDWSQITGLRQHLTLTDTEGYTEPHIMHWFTGVLHQPLENFENEEGLFFWQTIKDLPLPLGTMTNPAYAALPFILNLPETDTTLYQATFSFTDKTPTLNFL